ncbi:glycosyltransferase 61 family protein [Pararhodobacter zhoushanensis]|uniref:glycosyltransferase 61 family protein n=1 Tax=Pararhodobacter zhoushanensis TaxID=2479545 RepID=UPI000F8CAD32|nr:glycosyltransferase family 61 protein [Pararhodobacter zhoushanensis]
MPDTSEPRREAADTRLGRLPGMVSFENILVQGYTRSFSPGVFWPDFHADGVQRHFRNGAPICQPPVPAEEPPVRFPGEAVFLGANGSHFGHSCAEIVPRFLQSKTEHPDLPFILTGRLGHAEETSPTPVMSALLGWFGIDQQRVKIITAPTVFDQLHVAAQAEHLNGAQPYDEYLDLLDSLYAENGLENIANDFVYVSRAQLRPGYGIHAGESYLCSLLEAAGVRILYPERSPLRLQLALYAGAKRLIFAEGSALHGRQLLGRFPQKIDILERRKKKKKFAINQLAPRCDALTYVSATARNLTYKTETDDGDLFRALALYDVDTVLNYFESIGLPLKDLWDQAAFLTSQDDAILAWVRAIHGLRNKSHRAAGTGDHVIDQLNDAGLGHLEAEVRHIVADLNRAD